MQINFQTFKYLTFNKVYKKAQNNGVINPFARNEYDSVEISFGAKHCSTQNFRVKEIPNLHCPACGLIMLTEEQVGAFIRDVSSKRGQELADTLEKYEDESYVTGKPSRDKTGFGIYRPIKKEVVDIYKRLAIENPQMDLLDLTKLQAKNCINALIQEQMEVIKELTSFVEQNYQGDKKDNLLSKIEEYTKQINGKSDKQFARKKFIYAMKQAVDISHKDKVEQITSKMPTSENDVNSFFVKYAKKNGLTSSDIASKFVNQSIPTAEHVKPKVLGGANSLTNYICDCADCNAKRGHVPFHEWLQTLPEFEQRLQEYVNDVRAAIDADFFKDSPEYDTYVEKIIETLAEVTEGEVILEIPEVTNPAKNAAVLKRRESEIAKIKSQNDILAQRRDALRKEIAKLEEYNDFDDIDEHREILEELAKVSAEIDALTTNVIALRKPIYELKKEIESLEDQIESAKTEKEKESLRALYNTKNRDCKALEAEVGAIEKRCGAFKRKRINLKKQKKVFYVKEAALKAKIEDLRSLVYKIDALNEKIAKLGNWSQKEVSLSEKISQLQSQIDEATVQNNQIASNPDFNTNYSAPYNEYCHQKELLAAVDKMLNKQDYKKSGVKASHGREILEIAKKTIQKEIETLESSENVIYYINLINIKEWEIEKESLKEKLAEILKTKHEAQELQRQIDDLCAGRSEEQIRSEYKSLAEEKRTIDEIHKIGEKRTRLEHLTRIVRKNEIQLKKLENFRNMTNAQYAESMSFIELDDIF